MDYTLFVAIGLIGSLASAVFGFGTALLVIAVGSHVIPVKDAIALGTVLFTASTVTKTGLFAKHIDWKVVAVMAIGCLPFAYLGAQTLAVVPGDIIKRMFGLMVLIYLALSLTGWLPKFRIGLVGLGIGSAIYGFVSGLLGSGNLIKVMMFREMNITKEAFVGAMAATSVMSNFAKVASYTQSGLLRAEMAWPIVALVASAVIASFIGRAILRKIRAETFEIGVKVLLAVAAAALLI
ncbi:MAG: sulfite exporter TauE/SafE family protein [Hyphomicrobiaceae bacterium]|nr:sulfite exporter TauE/SafE family protein [Hyphomicrobiaceae bacterium]